jgi:hypothetical protein
MRHRNLRALLLSLAGALSLAQCGKAPSIYDSREFDSRLWKIEHGDNTAWTRRVTMLGDLYRNHLRVGMSRTEVESLLGPSEEERMSFQTWCICGDPGKTSSDESVLLIKFGSDDRAVEILGPGK